MAQIAREKGCARSTVGEALKSHSLERCQDDPVSYAAGQVPFGFRLQKGRLVVHRKEQSVIAHIVTLRGEGLSFGKIADHLNSNGVPTKNKSKGWDRPTIYKIVKRNSVRAETLQQTPRM